jgi:hypothetical protein
MKKNVLFLVVLLSFLISAQSQVTENYFSEIVSNTTGTQTIVPLTTALRVASLTGTKFKIDGLDEIPLEARNSLIDACKYWEEALNTDTINIKVGFIPMSTDSLAQGKVRNSNTPAYPISSYPYTPNTQYPLALLRHLKDTVHTNAPDVELYFNDNLDLWFFGGKTDYEIPPSKYDYTTYAMRMIAKGLGFHSNRQLHASGTSVILSSRTPFDRNLSNENNESLNAITNPVQIKNFMTSNNVFWKNNTGEKLYAPSTF